jgi:hypothetical protein
MPGKRLPTQAIALLVTFVMFQPDVLRNYSLSLEWDSFILSRIRDTQTSSISGMCCSLLRHGGIK